MGAAPMNLRNAAVCLFLFGSGLCALVYQTVWLREFRLIFGASTATSAAVLGIFMAGLGWGSALLGRRAEATAFAPCTRPAAPAAPHKAGRSWRPSLGDT